MSPASKSKSKDKTPAKVAKDKQNDLPKPSYLPATDGSDSASASRLEVTQASLLPTSQINAWSQAMDEMEQSCSSNGTDNDSSSVESDDSKDKVRASSTPKAEAVSCDPEKRDKIRQKNERKHQRQKEKRAQELYDRFTDLLMSKKFEGLTQQLVAMGFPAERSSAALRLNAGRIEDSISWLVDGKNDEQVNKSQIGASKLKMDISNELARIGELEIKFKCTKQEIQRVVVACAGDLDKAVETLKAQKKESPQTPPKKDAFSVTPSTNGLNKANPSTPNPVTELQREHDTVSVSVNQPRRNDGDFHFTKAVTTRAALSETGNRNLHPSRGVLPKVDQARYKIATQVDNRRPTMTSYAPSSKAGVALKEPVILMQRPQPINTTESHFANAGVYALPPLSLGSYPNSLLSIEMMKSANSSPGQGYIGRMGLKNIASSELFYQQNDHQHDAAKWGGAWSSSAGSYGSSSSSDWNMSSAMPQLDYTRVDWSLNLTPLTPSTVESIKANRLLETWTTAFMCGRSSWASSANDVHMAKLREDDDLLSYSTAAGERCYPFVWG